jgi:hypothetical protein
MPSSARFRNPKRLSRVPVNPIKSAPSVSKKIFLEKKDSARFRK